ncbi:MAG: type II toxin-antitoxin system PemK/MazF family toxin [Egibacteraceae bacterium]
MSVRQGQIWSVILDPTVANEQAGTRPCLVVSTDRFNSLPLRQSIIVPLTTRDRGLPHHVPVVDDGGLKRPSWAMCEAVRTISIQRFGRTISNASPETSDTVIRQIVMWLGGTI